MEFASDDDVALKNIRALKKLLGATSDLDIAKHLYHMGNALYRKQQRWQTAFWIQTVCCLVLIAVINWR